MLGATDPREDQNCTPERHSAEQAVADITGGPVDLNSSVLDTDRSRLARLEESATLGSRAPHPSLIPSM